ncbi:unnamed protein product [Rotaria sp. Silwood2]|nr:unnamed protein product [Rotaria sp. Silwood2]
MFQQLSGLSNVSTVGGAFIRGAGGTLVTASDSDDVTRSKVSAAATISGEFLTGVTSLNMLIIDKPTTYEKIDASTNKSLASSVIVLAVKRNTNVSTPLNISLFLQVLTEYQPSVNANYFCSFYDATKLTWNEFGCTKPRYNLEFDRYECSCNHTTTFALIWSTTIPGTLDTTSASVPGSSDSTSTTVPGTSDTSTITSDATTTTSGTTTTTSETTTTTSDVITTEGATSRVSTTSVILTSTRRPVCLNSSYVAFSNGTCVLNSVAQVW